jgi:hypothetical protein
MELISRKTKKLKRSPVETMPRMPTSRRSRRAKNISCPVCRPSLEMA